MAGEGEILRKTREEKGWSYEDVENNIKIRKLYLQALEEENYSILPGKTYTKGFLRTYSKFLGLKSED
ncbi:MAG: helix-turn-helix domain-containing protein, partial [Eubacteriales bacterium]